jgi:hypothetical protein
VLRSTVEDLLTFLAYQLGLESSPLSSAIEATRERQTDTAYPGVSIGLGWLLWDLPGGRVVQHDGATPGFTAFVGFHPGRRLGAVLLTNSRLNAYAQLTDVGMHLLDSTQPLTSIRRPAVVSHSALERCAGVFRSAQGDQFEIGYSRGRLVMYHVRSDFEFTVYPRSATRFDGLDLDLGGGANALFRQAVDGSVTALDWTQSGQTVSYPYRGGPARLSITPDADGVELALAGASTAMFDIEAGADQRGWERLGTLRPGTGTLLDPGGGPASLRLYRAVRRR